MPLPRDASHMPAERNLRHALPFQTHGHPELPSERYDHHQKIRQNATASHVLAVELSRPGDRGDANRAELVSTMTSRLQDHLREARMSLHGVVPTHSGYDDKNLSHFARAYVTFPSQAEAHQGALILQQHSDAKLPGGTLKVIPRRPHEAESFPGEKFHPALLTV